jgi:hypothetical protein
MGQSWGYKINKLLSSDRLCFYPRCCEKAKYQIEYNYVIT